MKKIFSLLFFLSLVRICYSQSISVSSFKLLDSDLTANTAGTMEQDQNGETAALIKVVTTQTGFTFDGGALGIVKTMQKPSEIWVYVPRGLKKMTISHPQIGMLRDYYFPITIEAARTYEMVLVSGEVQTIVKQARTSQYVVFHLTPSDAIVELNGEILKTNSGTATKMMKFGTYDYRVKAPNYLPEAGKVTINNPQEKQIVNVSLKPNFSQVILNVDNEAEIWINGEHKGNGSWTGNLGAGTYELETKKQYHRSTSSIYDISVSPEPQIIQLQAPSPIYGVVNINSRPAMADIIIDGKSVGQTPLFIDNLLIGPHIINIQKEKYGVFSSSFTLEENKTCEINASLKNIITVKINCNDPTANFYIDNVFCGKASGEKEIEIGKHNIEINPVTNNKLLRITKDIEIFGKESKLDFFLEPSEVSVSFMSDQPYTYLIVNGKIIATNICNRYSSYKFRPGLYEVIFRCKGKNEIVRELLLDTRHSHYNISFSNSTVDLVE